MILNVIFPLKRVSLPVGSPSPLVLCRRLQPGRYEEGTQNADRTDSQVGRQESEATWTAYFKASSPQKCCGAPTHQISLRKIEVGFHNVREKWSCCHLLYMLRESGLSSYCPERCVFWKTHCTLFCHSVVNLTSLAQPALSADEKCVSIQIFLVLWQCLI